MIRGGAARVCGATPTTGGCHSCTCHRIPRGHSHHHCPRCGHHWPTNPSAQAAKHAALLERLKEGA